MLQSSSIGNDPIAKTTECNHASPAPFWKIICNGNEKDIAAKMCFVDKWKIFQNGEGRGELSAKFLKAYMVSLCNSIATSYCIKLFFHCRITITQPSCFDQTYER